MSDQSTRQLKQPKKQNTSASKRQSVKPLLIQLVVVGFGQFDIIWFVIWLESLETIEICWSLHCASIFQK